LAQKKSIGLGGRGLSFRAIPLQCAPKTAVAEKLQFTITARLDIFSFQ
jgi:hypothetical protein